MVLQTINETLSLRLARLRRHVSAHPDGPTWLWEMRIRILEYLVSRYEREPSAARSRRDVNDARERDRIADALGFAMLDTVEEDLSERTLAMSARLSSVAMGIVDAERPLRARVDFSPKLESLSERNEESRFASGINPPVDAVWEWWRDTCCVRTSR